jgi:hypothetical protein
VGLERGPLSFLSTIEELFERKRSGSGLECSFSSVQVVLPAKFLWYIARVFF